MNHLFVFSLKYPFFRQNLSYIPDDTAQWFGLELTPNIDHYLGVRNHRKSLFVRLFWFLVLYLLNIDHFVRCDNQISSTTSMFNIIDWVQCSSRWESLSGSIRTDCIEKHQRRYLRVSNDELRASRYRCFGVFEVFSEFYFLSIRTGGKKNKEKKKKFDDMVFLNRFVS